MTHEHLDKIDKCRHLLPAPAPEVVRELVNDLRRYVTAMDALYNHNEAVRAAVVQHFGERLKSASVMRRREGSHERVEQ